MTTTAPSVLPKAGSGALREVWASVRGVLDLPRSVIVFEGAIDRSTLEEIVKKVSRGATARPGAIPKAELVGHLAEAFVTNVDVAFLIMRALDKSAHKERHIVASIDEASLDERLASYRALDFRRERARLLWALVRDGRAAHRAAAERIFNEAFEALAQSHQVEQVLTSKTQDPAALEALRTRLESYESAIKDQHEQLVQAQGLQETVEKERSELMARVGQRERSLREEAELRRRADEELRKTREELRAIEGRLEGVDEQRLAVVVEERDKARERVRALERQLERQLEHAEDARSLVEQRDALAAQVQELTRALERSKQAHDDERAVLIEREKLANERTAAVREELHEERRRKAAAPAVEDRAAGVRVGVFVDASNLSAGGRREFNGKFDFRALLPDLVGTRVKALAIAFLVNGDGESGEGIFQGFATTLRAAGYETREKRPRLRQDGSRKADWDMGIAMEILDALDGLDVVVLCSGDGDFVPLLQRVRRAGRRVEVAAFRAFADDALVRAADVFHALDERYRVSG